MAEVIKVAPGQKSNDLAVTLRALKPGSLTLTETKASASVTNPDGVNCNVSITSNLTVSSEPETITLNGSGEDYTVSCDASSQGRSFKLKGDWTAKAGENDGIRVNQQSDLYKFKVQGSELPGDCSLTVDFTYHYFGADVMGRTVIPVRTMGYIGLARDSEHYQAVARTEKKDPKVFGENEEKPAAPQGADVYLFVPKSEGELERFTVTEVTVKGADGSEHPLTLSQTGTGVWSDGAYALSFFQANGGPDVTVIGDFELYGAKLRLVGGSDMTETVQKITVTLSDPSIPGRSYTLSVSDVTAYLYELSFDSNCGTESTGTMHPIGLAQDTVTLPSNAFARAGYSFDSWNTQRDGKGATYENGADVTLAAVPDKTLYAQWKSNRFTVILVLDEGDENEYECYFYYNETELPDPTAEAPADPNAEDTRPVYWLKGSDPDKDDPVHIEYDPPEAGKRFAGWGTSYAGDEVSYYAGDTIQTGTDGMRLFAKWEDIQEAILSLYYSTASDALLMKIDGDAMTALTGKSDLSGTDYAALINSVEKHGWDLEGWYTSDGTKILDGSGRVIARKRGITAGSNEMGFAFAVDGACELHARWTKTAYVRLDELTASGTYLIGTASDDNGKIKFMRTDSSGNISRTINDMELNATKGGSCSAGGESWDEYIEPDQVTDFFRWEAKEVVFTKYDPAKEYDIDGQKYAWWAKVDGEKTADGEEKELPVDNTIKLFLNGQTEPDYFGVTLKNLKKGTYLRNENTSTTNSSLSLKTAANWTTGGKVFYNDRFTWMTYEVEKEGAEGGTVTLIQSAFKCFEQANSTSTAANRFDSIGWDGSQWTTGSYMTSYFYQLRLIYTDSPF